MSAELAPCPFCGGIAKMGLTARVEWKDTVSVFCVHCSANVCRTGPVQSEATKRQVNEAWNLRTPPAMSADHIPDAGNMIEPVEAVAWRGEADGIDDCTTRPDTRDDWIRYGRKVTPLFTHPPQPDAQGWRDIATAPRDGTMLLVGYDEGVAREGAMEDRQRVFEARWNDVQGTWSARNGFLLHSDATHWQPLPHPPSAHPAPIKPSADTGELRERVGADLMERLGRRAIGGHWVTLTYLEADAILDLIKPSGDTDPAPLLEIVRLPDANAMPIAVGEWTPEKVEPGKRFEIGSGRIKLELVSGTQAHAPIKPSGDTGELRERVARAIFDSDWPCEPADSLEWNELKQAYLNNADAILDLIQSERAG